MLVIQVEKTNSLQPLQKKGGEKMKEKVIREIEIKICDGCKKESTHLHTCSACKRELCEGDRGRLHGAFIFQDIYDYASSDHCPPISICSDCVTKSVNMTIGDFIKGLIGPSPIV